MFLVQHWFRFSEYFLVHRKWGWKISNESLLRRQEQDIIPLGNFQVVSAQLSECLKLALMREFLRLLNLVHNSPHCTHSKLSRIRLKANLWPIIMPSQSVDGLWLDVTSSQQLFLSGSAIRHTCYSSPFIRVSCALSTCSRYKIANFQYYSSLVSDYAELNRILADQWR